LSAEEKILNSARRVFLLYGFQATTIKRIATDAKVSKTAIHYYYRSKEKLYDNVVREIGREILDYRNDTDGNLSVGLFVLNEFKSNRVLFVKALNNYNKLKWDDILQHYIKYAIPESISNETLDKMF
jgi:AcrR family transcriptional regulator